MVKTAKTLPKPISIITAEEMVTASRYLAQRWQDSHRVSVLEELYTLNRLAPPVLALICMELPRDEAIAMTGMYALFIQRATDVSAFSKRCLRDLARYGTNEQRNTT